MITKSNTGRSGWAVWQDYEMFGDAVPHRFDTKEEADAAADKVAAGIADMAYPGGLVTCGEPGEERGGISHETEFCESLTELSGATHDTPGRLPMETIARHIRNSAIRVEFGFGSAENIMLNPHETKYPTDCNGMTAVSVEAYKHPFTFGRSVVNWISYLERSDRDTGAIRASDLFGAAELVRLGCPADETVYLHEVL